MGLGYVTLRVGPLTALSSAMPAPARARMCGLVNARQMLKVQVSIDLSGADVGVAEQFLHAAQIAARLQQMSGERMAEHMRMHMHAEPHAAAPGGDAQLHGANRQRPAALPHKKRLRTPF